MRWQQRDRFHISSSKTAWDKDIPCSNMYPPNMTLNWVDTDSPENAQYSKDIEYRFNEHGFRSDSFYEDGDLRLLTCGCSITVGVGVNQNETWTNLLAGMIADEFDKSVVAWNLATSGASGDYVVRNIWKVDERLFPDLIFVFWPPFSRLELPLGYDSGKLTQSFIHSNGYPELLIDEDFLIANQQKNKIFLENIYRRRPSMYYCNPHSWDSDLLQVDNAARDGMHPGPEWHMKTAEYFFNQSKDDIKNVIKHLEIKPHKSWFNL